MDELTIKQENVNISPELTEDAQASPKETPLPRSDDELQQEANTLLASVISTDEASARTAFLKQALELERENTDRPPITKKKEEICYPSTPVQETVDHVLLEIADSLTDQEREIMKDTVTELLVKRFAMNINTGLPEHIEGMMEDPSGLYSFIGEAKQLELKEQIGTHIKGRAEKFIQENLFWDASSELTVAKTYGLLTEDEIRAFNGSVVPPLLESKGRALKLKAKIYGF